MSALARCRSRERQGGTLALGVFSPRSISAGCPDASPGFAVRLCLTSPGEPGSLASTSTTTRLRMHTLGYCTLVERAGIEPANLTWPTSQATDLPSPQKPLYGSRRSLARDGG